MNEPRYRLLRIIATVLKVLAFVVLVAGVIGLIGGLSTAGGVAIPELQSILRAGSWVLPVMGIVTFVQLYAFGSIISLLVEIEATTRAMAAE